MENTQKKLLVNISGSFLVKGFSIIVSYLATPAYIIYFQKSPILGVWLTLVGMLTWIINFDLGIGNGLRNKIVYYFLNKDMNMARKYISSAYGMLATISLAIMILGSICIHFLNWNTIFNISTKYISTNNLQEVITITFCGVLIYFVFKIVSSILLALEKVAIVNALVLITNLSNLIFIYIIDEDNPEQAIMKLAWFYVFSLNVPYIITSIILFRTKLKQCSPKIKQVDKQVAKGIIGLGGQFFFIQIMLMIINSTNEFFITFFYEPDYVVEYQIYYKLFYLIVTLFSLVSNPVWSNIAVAYNRKDYAWIKKVMRKLDLLSCLCVGGLVIVVMLFPQISQIWLGNNNINYDYKIGTLYCLYCALMIFVLAETAIANGVNLLRMQMIGFTVGGLIRIFLIYVFAKLGFGWESVVLVNIIILAPFVVFQKIDLRRTLKQYNK